MLTLLSCPAAILWVSRPAAKGASHTYPNLERSAIASDQFRVAGVDVTDRAAFRQCSFDFVPPRNFLFPAVLLIVADRPCHGYGIAAQLPALGFGTTDRPAVYRTLAKLEADGLVYRSVGVRDQGDTRTVYRISPSGEERLSEWVAVMEAQQRAIGAVVARYYDEATALTAS